MGEMFIRSSDCHYHNGGENVVGKAQAVLGIVGTLSTWIGYDLATDVYTDIMASIGAPTTIPGEVTALAFLAGIGVGAWIMTQ